MSTQEAVKLNKNQFINTNNKEIENRWNSLNRLYSVNEVKKLQGSIKIEYSLARQGAEKLWKHLNQDDFVRTFGVLTGNQAVQHAKAGLKAIEPLNFSGKRDCKFNEAHSPADQPANTTFSKP